MVSNVGEVVVYEGDDPGASNWTIWGRFYMPMPLSRRAFVDIGPDVVVLTEEGVIPLSTVLSQEGVASGYAKLSDKINDGFTSAARANRNNFGWDTVIYPRSHMLIVNNPISDAAISNQFVLNTQNGAWAEFTGINASCWCIHNEKPYFGGMDGKVYEFDIGNDDAGANIKFRLKTAFNYYGDRTRMKHIKMARANILSNNALELAFNIDTDFGGTAIDQVVTTSGSGGFAWDASDSEWDIAEWDDAEQFFNDWRTVTGLGRAGAIMVEGDFDNVSFSISSFDVIFEPGGLL